MKTMVCPFILCAFPILDSAVSMINEMNNFYNGNITKYF